MNVFIQFTKEQKMMMIEDIQRYYYQENGDEIGELAAENLLEFIKESIGPHFYNQAVKDAKNLVEQRMQSMEEDLYALERTVKR